MTTLYLLYQAWGAKMTCREWKAGDGIKKFEKHCFRIWCAIVVQTFSRSTVKCCKNVKVTFQQDLHNLRFSFCLLIFKKLVNMYLTVLPLDHRYYFNAVLSSWFISLQVNKGDDDREGLSEEQADNEVFLAKNHSLGSSSLRDKSGGNLSKQRSVNDAEQKIRLAYPDNLRLHLRDVMVVLIVANACMWLFLSLEETAFSVRSYPYLQYGHSAWTTFTMITNPFIFFLRMHSAGCLFEIWSYA